MKKITSDEARLLRGAAGCSITYYGAYIEGQLVGVIGRRFRAWYATELCHLYVSSEHRKKGIGTALIAHALERVKTPLAVATVQINNKSYSIFEKMGFRHISTVLNPNTGNNVMILSKEIKN